jgi:hypothetical protein
MKFRFFNYVRTLRMFGFIFLLLIIISGDSSKAQSSQTSGGDSVSVKSWKEGDSIIAEQVLRLSLEDQNQYEVNVYDVTKQNHYRLHLRQTFEKTVNKPLLPCWSVVFREVTKDTETGGHILGWDMLNRQGPGMGNYFPREDWAEVFCPIEQPRPVLDGLLYPIKAERKFLIEKFVLVLQVTDYQLDEKENRLKKMDLKVEFKNQNQN